MCFVADELDGDRARREAEFEPRSFIELDVTDGLTLNTRRWRLDDHGNRGGCRGKPDETGVKHQYFVIPSEARNLSD